MRPRMVSCVSGALVVAWTLLCCRLSAAPVAVPATLLPGPAQLFSEPFDLGPENPTVEFEFVPTKQGRHSAVAVCDGDEELQMSVGVGGKYRSGRSGLVSVFAGAEGDPVTIRLRLRAEGGAAVIGTLTVMHGVDRAASNRPSKPTLPGGLLPAATDPDTRDALLPTFVHLAERYSGDASDRNELDLVFTAAVEGNPGLTRTYSRAMVRQ